MKIPPRSHRRATALSLAPPARPLLQSAPMTRAALIAVTALLLSCESQDGASDPEVYFCADPHGTCTEVVAGLVGEAGSTVECAIYSLTDEDIAQSLIDAAGRGVQVWVLYDESQAGGKDMKALVELLGNSGVYVRADGNPSIMHHKFVVVDGAAVATGSFNFTNNANWNNDENLLVIRSPGIAGQYSAEFRRVWEEGQ